MLHGNASLRPLSPPPSAHAGGLPVPWSAPKKSRRLHVVRVPAPLIRVCVLKARPDPLRSPPEAEAVWKRELGPAERIAIRRRIIGSLWSVLWGRESVELLAGIIVVDVPAQIVAAEVVSAVLDAPQNATRVEREADLVAQPARPRRRAAKVDRLAPLRTEHAIHVPDARTEVVLVNVAIGADGDEETTARDARVHFERASRMATRCPAVPIRTDSVCAGCGRVRPTVHRGVGGGEQVAASNCNAVVKAWSGCERLREQAREECMLSSWIDSWTIVSPSTSPMAASCGGLQYT
eukprot:1010076-Pleurochrysis_carterae.AAC.1